MNNLILKGLTQVSGMKFNHIEGGFGENKKSMLAKDIAEIHGKELKAINQSINMNRKRFKDGVDIIDLKSVNQIDRDLLFNLGFSNSSIANSRNIYLLSERGYSKLLKILEDDFAWEQYEKLVDGYFNMRQAVKTLSFEDMMIAQLEEQKKLKNRVEVVEEKLESLEISPSQRKQFKNLRNKRVLELLGGKKSKAYKDSSFRGKVYSDLTRQYNNYFDIPSYELTPKNRFEEGIKLVNAYNLTAELSMELDSIKRK